MPPVRRRSRAVRALFKRPFVDHIVPHADRRIEPFPTAAAARSAGLTSGVSRDVYVMAAASLTNQPTSKPES